MASEDGCAFCGIVAGDVPAEVVRIGERVVAFRDLNPQAPLHALVVPRDHHRGRAGARRRRSRGAGRARRGRERRWRRRRADGSFRLVFNTGAESGQTVFHVHGHVLAGRPFGWPPG